MIASGCSPADAKKDEAVDEPRTSVAVESVRRGKMMAVIQATSTIDAERKVTVHAESTGRVESLAIEEGDAVREGALIARIRADSQAAGLDRARTNLDKARRDLDTVERLYRQSVTSREELDSARVAYETAALDVRDRKRDVRNTKVVSPIAGIVTERVVEQDTYVSAGTPLFTVTDFDTLVARIYVPEKQLDEIAVGQLAMIVGKAARGRVGTGRVTRIAPTVDAATGTIKVTVALDPWPDPNRGFLPGMYTEVSLTTQAHDDALLVPRRALIRDGDVASVFVVGGEKAERRILKLGLMDNTSAEVLDGLEDGEEVIVAGQAGLRDGALIQR